MHNLQRTWVKGRSISRSVGTGEADRRDLDLTFSLVRAVIHAPQMHSMLGGTRCSSTFEPQSQSMAPPTNFSRDTPQPESRQTRRRTRNHLVALLTVLGLAVPPKLALREQGPAAQTRKRRTAAGVCTTWPPATQQSRCPSNPQHPIRQAVPQEASGVVSQYQTQRL